MAETYGNIYYMLGTCLKIWIHV